MTPGVVHSILEDAPERVARALEAAPRECALVEIRADGLRAGDAAGLVRRAGHPVVVTVRSVADRGLFDGTTAEKSAILDAALDAGCAYVDVEWDGPMRPLAFGARASRVILSHHDAACDGGSLAATYAAMSESRAPLLKIVPRATRPSELRVVRDLLDRARAAHRELCAFAVGPAGAWSRVVALSWGSWGVYGAAERGRETGAGQFTTRELLDVYRVHALSDATRSYGLVGTQLAGSPSPAMHAAGYRALGLDAVYIPVDTDDADEVASLVAADGLLPLAGFGVTIPLKERVAALCPKKDAFAACGAVNTVCVGSSGWEGFNTDAPAAMALIGKHLDPKDLEAAIVGAGGTARAIGAALKDAGAAVTFYARNAMRGEVLARSIGAGAAPLSTLPGARWDLLVQATPLGRHGEEVLLRRHLNGRMVLDAAYGAEATPLVRAARARGLTVVEGHELLAAQGALQFERLTGRPAPVAAMTAELHASLSAASA